MVNIVLVTLCASVFVAAAAHAQGFKFSHEDQSDRALAAERQARVQAQLAAPCRDKIKNQKIMVMIAENRNGLLLAHQAAYRPHFNAINDRLRALGLKTYTPEEIRRQIAQAQIDAYFRNDPDAARKASKRLAAQYILRGLITTEAARNALVNVNQVSVSMTFTLTTADGRVISQTSARNESYAGRDTSDMALTLINERSEEVVAQLYSDYCGSDGRR